MSPLPPVSLLLACVCLSLITPSLPAQGIFAIPDGSSAGVGIALAYDGETLYASTVMPDSPAAASKQIQEGHRILAVGQGEEPAVSLKGKTIEECVLLIRGPAGSQVRLTVLPKDGAPSLTREVILTRDELRNPLGLALDGSLLNPGAPAPALRYLRLGEGKPATLAEAHRGQYVVVKFWATWSEPSHQAVADLQQVAAKFADRKDKLAFLTPCIDGTPDPAKSADVIKKVSAFVQEQKWTSTTQGWSSVEDRRDWHLAALPMTYIVSPDGKILFSDPREPLEGILDALLLGE
jgi:thiol-disulfide isomerase/thioredoxin